MTHGKPARPVGSRLPLAYARETGANFLTASPLEAARARTAITSTCSATWPPTSNSPTGPSTAGGRTRQAPWKRSASRTPPGRFDPAYLNSLRAFDVAFVLDLGDGTRAVGRLRAGVDALQQRLRAACFPAFGGFWVDHLDVVPGTAQFSPGSGGVDVKVRVDAFIAADAAVLATPNATPPTITVPGTLTLRMTTTGTVASLQVVDADVVGNPLPGLDPLRTALVQLLSTRSRSTSPSHWGPYGCWSSSARQSS